MQSKDSRETHYVYSPGIIPAVATSLADAFIARVARYRPEDRITLVRCIRQHLLAKAPELAALLAGTR